jgi:Gram-negative bacterial TonB protein C-terminal
MSSITSLFQTPEEPQPASTVTGRLSRLEQSGAPLLELRTDAGPVYVCPSRWQRVRLQWIFRHFHVLPPQVLSRRDRRLIEKLSRSAVVTPSLPVPRDAVLGVVEKVPSKPPASAPRVVMPTTQPAATQTIPAKSGIPTSPTPLLYRVAKQTEKREASFQQWGALGTLATVAFTVILASAYGIPLLSRTRHGGSPRSLSTPIRHVARAAKTANIHAAVTSSVPAPANASSPNIEKSKRRMAPQPPGPLENETAHLLSAKTGKTETTTPPPALATVPDTNPELDAKVPRAISERGFVSNLPQGHFAHPVVSNGNLVGELQLKALIGPDGSVKEVTVLRGDPKLAEAGIRAVRQWHYSPDQTSGSAAERETHIKMSFFGEDAVSIAAVSDGPNSQLK